MLMRSHFTEQVLAAADAGRVAVLADTGRSAWRGAWSAGTPTAGAGAEEEGTRELSTISASENDIYILRRLFIAQHWA